MNKEEKHLDDLHKESLEKGLCTCCGKKLKKDEIVGCNYCFPN